MLTKRRRLGWLLPLLCVSSANAARAETTLQLWLNLMVEWHLREQLRPRATEPGAVIGLFDWEYFIPIDRDLRERYASRHRVRVGVGYRPVPAWRFDLIYL